MARPKGSKNKPKKTPKEPEIPKNDQNGAKNAPNSPKTEQKAENQVRQVEPQPKSERPEEFMTPFEAAEHFGVNEPAIKLWIEHGHLELTRGGLIPMTSIKMCRFRVRKVL